MEVERHGRVNTRRVTDSARVVGTKKRRRSRGNASAIEASARLRSIQLRHQDRSPEKWSQATRVRQKSVSFVTTFGKEVRQRGWGYGLHDQARRALRLGGLSRDPAALAP